MRVYNSKLLDPSTLAFLSLATNVLLLFTVICLTYVCTYMYYCSVNLYLLCEMSQETEKYATFHHLKQATSFVSTSLSEPVQLHIGKQGLTAAAPQTIPQLLRDCCQRFPNSPALAFECYNKNKRDINNITWKTITYSEYERNVEKTALALLQIGLIEKTSVCVLAHNCPEWYYVQFGALLFGAVVSGIYLTSSAEAVKYALEASAATVCVVGDATQLAKVCAVRKELPLLRAVILLQECFEEDFKADGSYYLWSDLMALTFDHQLHQELLLKKKQVSANQCAMLIFTVVYKIQLKFADFLQSHIFSVWYYGISEGCNAFPRRHRIKY